MTSLVRVMTIIQLMIAMRSSSLLQILYDCTTYLDNYNRLLSNYLQYSAHMVIRMWFNSGGKRHAREETPEGQDTREETPKERVFMRLYNICG